MTATDKIQIWQHFVSAGGADKERMITIVTWLLGLSAALLGYFGAHIFDPAKSAMGVPAWMRFPALLGMVVSGFVVYIEEQYRSHATWNWNRADSVANEPELVALQARPPNQTHIFAVFLVLALVSLLLHGAMLLGALCQPSPTLPVL